MLSLGTVLYMNCYRLCVIMTKRSIKCLHQYVTKLSKLIAFKMFIVKPIYDTEGYTV